MMMLIKFYTKKSIKHQLEVRGISKTQWVSEASASRWAFVSSDIYGYLWWKKGKAKGKSVPHMNGWGNIQSVYTGIFSWRESL